jgi:hypothetical protein
METKNEIDYMSHRNVIPGGTGTGFTASEERLSGVTGENAGDGYDDSGIGKALPGSEMF